MTKEFKAGDHVEWNSEAGHVRGTIKKRIISAITFKGYTVHASKEEPQYLIQSATIWPCTRVQRSRNSKSNGERAENECCHAR